jgi:predicted nucleotidyltransferase
MEDIMCDKTVLDAITKKAYVSAKEVLGDRLEKIILFGSYARGDYREDSDIDIMILADIQPEEADNTEDKIRSLMGDYNLDVEYGVLISLMAICSAMFHKYINASPFYKNVQEEGVILYA